LANCSLGDLGYWGWKFTWSNKRDSAEFVKERLDRALATSGWCSCFPEVVVHMPPALTSDHKPLWI
jgi:hypothetical protein